jgi:hypothetical protein
MRFASLLCLLALTWMAPAASGVVDTVSFEADRLYLDPVSRTVTYGNLDWLAEDNRPALPYLRRIIVADRSAPVPRCRILRADTITLGFAPSLTPPDQPTADQALAFVHPPTVLAAAEGCYPRRPYHIDHQQTGGRSSWTLLLFPVQFLDDDRLVLTRQIEIIADGQSDSASSVLASLISGHGVNAKALAVADSSDGGPPGCPLGHELIIVTSPGLTDAVTSLLHLKMQTGFDAAMAVTDSIAARYNGCDSAEKLRNYLKAFYAAGGRYAMLVGDETQVPIRYAYYYDTDVSPSVDKLMICDLYFADLSGDWDRDGDGIWGELTQDSPDCGPELLVGRLPFSTAAQVAAYTAKLRAYLFHPGDGDASYLERALFFTSDQMRDYFEGGQQYRVAENFPATVVPDCERLAESPTGYDVAPTGPFPSQALDALNSGYGMINILAHGRADGFVLSSSAYNEMPKSYLLTTSSSDGNAAVDQLARRSQPALYYSIACDQGAIDMETILGLPGPSVVEKLLAADSAGAVGMVAFSRWGWISSSYKLMASFYAHLFSDAGGNPAAAMHASHLDYLYYRDQVYGQNFYGDPSLVVYVGQPQHLEMDCPDRFDPSAPLVCRVSAGGNPTGDCRVTMQTGPDSFQTLSSDAEGIVSFSLPPGGADSILIYASPPGAIGASAVTYPSLSADGDDDQPLLPQAFDLSQNFPNPFNPATTITFTLARAGGAKLDIFDILGRLVACPINGRLSAGEHAVTWTGVDNDGRDLPSGVYFYRLACDEGTITRKMMLVK